MHKKILAAIISLILMSSQMSLSIVANAAPNDAIENSNIKIKELDKQIIDLNAQMSTLNNEIGTLNDTLSKNNTEIKDTENKIKDAEDKINKTKDVISKKEDILGGRLRGIYKSDVSSNPLLMLITSESFSEFLSNSEAFAKMISFDKKVINDLDSEKSSLSNQLTDLNDKQSKLQDLKLSTENSLKDLKDKQSEKQSVLDKFNSEKQHELSIIEENETTLISHSLSVIESSNSANDLLNAISTLKQLLPTITSSSVKNKAENAISKANSKLSSLQQPNLNRGGDLSISSAPSSAKRSYSMEATAYCDGLITANGSNPVRNSSGLSTVAVDPSVIPLGSKLYVSGYGYALAADTGGDIKGMRIDLYMNSLAECYQFGRQSVTVQVIAYPGEW